MPYFVYLVECSDGSYYCGYTTDLKRRISEHNSSKKGSKYTHNKRPVFLKYSEEYETLSEALKREHQIKKLSRPKKEDLVNKVV